MMPSLHAWVTQPIIAGRARAARPTVAVRPSAVDASVTTTSCKPSSAPGFRTDVQDYLARNPGALAAPV